MLVFTVCRGGPGPCKAKTRKNAISRRLCRTCGTDKKNQKRTNRLPMLGPRQRKKKNSGSNLRIEVAWARRRTRSKEKAITPLT